MPVSDLDVSSIVARTSRSYDALPYQSDPFPRTHPSALAAIAHLFALETAPPGEARILELGCASGGNIIPLAARHPAAAVVGIDLSAAQVAAGRARIAHLGLANIDIRCQDFSEFLGATDAPFDYIICHGVYSWVPAPLREQILRICRKCLSPRGVALVSYNVLPGWRPLQALRDCFLLHVSPDADPRRRVAEVRALLGALAQACPEPGPYKELLARDAERLQKSSDDYIAHEFLDDINEPCSFRDFAAAARRHGLGFLAEAALPSMIPTNYPPQTAEAVRKIGGASLLGAEQAIDMATGRTFRRSLLVAAEREPQIDRRLTNARIEGLHFIGSATLTLMQDGVGATLSEPNGRRLHTDSAPLTAALAQFVEGFPGSTTVDDLVAAMPPGLRNAEGHALAREGLLNMAVNGLAIPRADPVPAVARAGALPVACPMVRAVAARGDATTVNLRHERVELDVLPRFVLPLLDGSRDAGAIAAAMADAVREGRLDLNRDKVESDERDAVAIAIDNLKSLLPALARATLLLR
jgi:cyclopropane fatty-acyl-phospholipid synthase-like methyltransferase/methyltransferase-like protein